MIKVTQLVFHQYNIVSLVSFFTLQNYHSIEIDHKERLKDLTEGISVFINYYIYNLTLISLVSKVFCKKLIGVPKLLMFVFNQR